MSAVAVQAMPTHISVRATEDRIEDFTGRGPNPWAALGSAPQGERVCLSRQPMKGKSEKAKGDALMPAATVHGKRKRPKFGSLGRGLRKCCVSNTMTANHLSTRNDRRPS